MLRPIATTLMELLLGGASLLGLAACETQGEFEEAGEEIDEAVDEVDDAF